MDSVYGKAVLMSRIRVVPLANAPNLAFSPHCGPVSWIKWSSTIFNCTAFLRVLRLYNVKFINQRCLSMLKWVHCLYPPGLIKNSNTNPFIYRVFYIIFEHFGLQVMHGYHGNKIINYFFSKKYIICWPTVAEWPYYHIFRNED